MCWSGGWEDTDGSASIDEEGEVAGRVADLCGKTTGRKARDVGVGARWIALPSSSLYFWWYQQSLVAEGWRIGSG